MEYWKTPASFGEHVWTDKSRPFRGLCRQDPIIHNLRLDLYADFMRFPGVEASEAGAFMSHAPLRALERFILENRNEK